jgi:hypothetical protein
MNLDIETPLTTSTKQRMTTHVLLKFRYIPKLSDIRKWEEHMKSLRIIEHPIHDVFESSSAVIPKGDEWINIKDNIENDFDDYDDDCGIFYLENYQPFQLGKQINTDRYILSDSWLTDYIDHDFVKDFAFNYKDQLSSEHLQLEQIVQGIMTLGWKSSVDWETGYDEGNFVPGEVKWTI